MTASSPERLAELRRRWQAEPGSRLFLQLAEEYRRAERHAEAVEVLENGLEHHPNQVSAHVALGRARLEMGEAGAAVASLERALALDATNLVANKALVEAYLEEGERDKARQRLDLYRLLNDTDPDVPELRRRIDGRLPPPPRPAQAAEGGDADATAVDAGSPPAPAGGAEPAAPEPTRVDESTAGEPAVAAAPRKYYEPPSAAEPSPARSERAPGSALADGALAEGHAWGGEATAESLEPPSPAEAAAGGEPDATADRSWGWGEALEEEPMRARTGQADVNDGMEETGGSVAAGGGGQPFGDLAAADAARRYLDGLSGEGLFPLPAAPPPPVAAAAPESLPEPRPAEVEALAAPPAESATAAPTAEPESPVPSEPPSSAPPSAERPTVTLGQLYLDQGHFAEARRVFAALLEGEPDHEVARRGLARAERELAAAGPQPVTAAELLRDAEPDQPARRAVLGAYLARILRGKESRPPDVPR